MQEITDNKIKKYFSITKKALSLAEKSKNKIGLDKEREDFLDMIRRYVKDAEHFYNKKDLVNTFACLNYAHGWIDAGARIGLFDVHNSKYFTVD